MTDRLSSGSKRLDLILGGGLPANAVNLIVGLPGSGKSMLVQQYVFANATEERPAVALSTVSEPFDKQVRYGQLLSYFDASALGRSVFFEDMGQSLNRAGLDGVLERFDDVIRRRHPGMVVVDSFRALRSYGTDEEFRRFLHDIAGRCSAYAASHFWVGEYTENDMAWAPEFAVADAILSLSTGHIGERSQREIQVLKLRGSTSLSGRHAYRLGVDGVEVFPRLADPGFQEPYVLEPIRSATGIQALDELMEDGYHSGSSTLIAGPTGSGKTLLGLHFLFNGARNGEPGLLASLQENPSQLERVATGFGWSLEDGGVETIYASPVDLYVDEWVYDLLDRAEAVSARRIVVDSLTDLSFAVPDPVRFREYLYSLVQRCSRRGISLMLTLEIPHLFDMQYVGREGVSHLSDNVVLLQYARDDDRLTRMLTLLKSRATRHQPQIREFRIGDDGIVLADSPFSSS